VRGRAATTQDDIFITKAQRVIAWIFKHAGPLSNVLLGCGLKTFPVVHGAMLSY
jgi:hypothetical protein